MTNVSDFYMAIFQANNIGVDLQHELQMNEDNLEDARILAEDVLWDEDGSYPRVIVLTAGDSGEELHRIRCIVCEAVKVSISYDVRCEVWGVEGEGEGVCVWL